MWYSCFESICIAGSTMFIDSGKIKAILLFLAILISLLIFQKLTRLKFRDKQMDFPRVREAFEEKDHYLRQQFSEAGIKYPPGSIFIRIFKEEKLLELWANSKKRDPFKLIGSYKICCMPGLLGPKREEGDKQVPEGFYYIDRFNPLSKYHLSLGINYPNESDCILGVRGRLGGDIFIHGGDRTVGCIPVNDDKIKELYLVAVQAVSSGQDRIPVHIFPKRLDDRGLNELKSRFSDNKGLIQFWENLKEGYDFFERTHHLPKITTGMDGRYIVRN